VTHEILGHIAHVVENLDDTYGGPARSVPNLAARSRDLGWSVRLYSVQWSTTERNDVVDREALDWVRCGLRGPRKICFSPQLLRSLQSLETATRPIIHLHTLWNAASLCAVRVAMDKRIPLVISTRGALFPWALSQGRLRKSLAWRAFVRAALQKAALVHVTEPREASVVRGLGISTPLILVPNGVEQAPAPGLEARFDLHAAERNGSRTFLFLSRIHKSKGVDLLLEAWSRSVARQLGGRLEIVGPCASPAYQSELQRRASDLGIAGTVRFLGMLRGAERERMFSDADVFVLPSYTENFGVAIVEALARGLPVITTTGTPWRAIEDQRAGWWIDLTIDNLVSALDDAAGYPRETLLAMGHNAVNLARQFGWEEKAHALSEAYQWIFGGPQPGALITDGSAIMSQ
jgi:glycosyltransferase involved in cell wall biosynthesis